MELKFYQCENCGQIIAKVNDTGVPVVCCGKPMKELIAGTVEASREKHIPVYSVEGGVVTVKIGSIPHPMIAEHYIEWVVLRTKEGNQRKQLKPGSEPEVCFRICECDEVLEVYAYCNLHGLWKA